MREKFRSVRWWIHFSRTFELFSEILRTQISYQNKDGIYRRRKKSNHELCKVSGAACFPMQISETKNVFKNKSRTTPFRRRKKNCFWFYFQVLFSTCRFYFFTPFRRLPSSLLFKPNYSTKSLEKISTKKIQMRPLFCILHIPILCWAANVHLGFFCSILSGAGPTRGKVACGIWNANFTERLSADLNIYFVKIVFLNIQKRYKKVNTLITVMRKKYCINYTHILVVF